MPSKNNLLGGSAPDSGESEKQSFIFYRSDHPEGQKFEFGPEVDAVEMMLRKGWSENPLPGFEPEPAPKPKAKPKKKKAKAKAKAKKKDDVDMDAVLAAFDDKDE